MFYASLICFSQVIDESPKFKVKINYNDSTKDFKHFWKSTGYTPAEITLNDEMKQAIAYYGSINNDGVRYLRVHYLLNLISCDSIQEIFDDKCDYSQLDSTINIMVSNNIKPIFELMGNPSDIFNDFGDSLQLYAYKELVKNIAERYIEKYGADEVTEWYFETVNEPNWPGWWKYGYEQFLHYYDACSEGLKEAHPGIHFGGPGTYQTTRMRTMFKVLLDHCHNGVNYFTGERSVRLDYISYHFKDLPHQMIDLELGHINYVKKNYPKFKHIPYSNDEADPTVGWKRDLWWRAGPWYSAFIAQSAQLHSDVLVDSNDVNYHLLSNDHGFLGNWYNRTMLTRFYNQDSSGFYLIKKPAFTVFSIMSLLGDKKWTVARNDSLHDVGLLVTKRENGDIVILAVNKPEFDFKRHADWWKKENKVLLDEEDEIMNKFKSQTKSIELEIDSIDMGDAIIATYTIDELHTNPYKIWKELGSPKTPTADQFIKMQKNQEPDVEIIQDNILQNYSMQITLGAPSVKVIVISQKDKLNPPKKVENLTYELYTGVGNKKQCLLKWDDVQKSIHRYEVFYSANKKDYYKVEQGDLIDCAFLHLLPTDKNEIFYKVRAVDYLGREGAFSAPIIVQY
jgi:L-iduronidase